MTGNDSHEAFVEKAYRDTYDLLVAVRDYVSAHVGDEADGELQPQQPQQRLQLTYELSRVTRRLTDVMAWLMIRKAVAAGEITEAEAEGRAPAPSAFENAPDLDTDMAALPLPARSLIDRTRRLEADVRHLEASLSSRDDGGG